MKYHSLIGIFQHYFTILTTQRLRISFILHSIIFLVFFVSIFFISLLYDEYIRKECPIDYHSAFNIIQFLNSLFHMNFIASLFFISALNILIINTISLILLSISTVLWEDLLKPKFSRSPQINQLRFVQVIVSFSFKDL